MATYADTHLKIFSLGSNQPLAEKVADAVGVIYLRSTWHALAITRFRLILRNQYVGTTCM